MFEDTKILSAPKIQRLKTKDVKSLRKTLQAAFPWCLGGGEACNGEDCENNLYMLLPRKAGVNRSQFKSRDFLYSVAQEKGSKSFTPLFYVVNKGHEIIPTIFALWKCPGLLRAKFYTHAAVSSKLIKSPPADLFLPGTMLTQGSEWNKNDLVAVLVAHNPKAFAVGRASCSSTDATASGMTGTACIIIHHYLDQIWNLCEESPPEGFYKDRVDVPASVLSSIKQNREDQTKKEDDEREVAQDEQNVIEETRRNPDAPSTTSSLDFVGEAPMDDFDKNLNSNGEAKQNFDSATEISHNDRSAQEGDEEYCSQIKSSSDDCRQVISSDSKASMDTLMLDTVLVALSSVPKTEVPILANVFNSKYFLPSRNEGTIINVKQSGFSKFGLFLHHIEEHYGWIELGSSKGGGSNGVLKIKSIDKSSVVSAMRRRGLRNRRNLNSEDSGPVVSLDLFKVPAQALHIFEMPENFGLLFRKGRDLGAKKRKIVRLYTRGDVARVLAAYIDANDLTIDGEHQIRLNAALCDFAFTKPYPTSVGKKQLAKAFVKKMQPWHTFLREKSGDASAWVQRERTRQSSDAAKSLAWHDLPPADSGLPSKICIWVERNKQRGDKFLTTVQNLESFGIDVRDLAARGNKLFACNSLAQKDTRKPRNDKSLELLLSGNLASKVIAELGKPSNGQIPSRFFVINKQKGV